MTGLQIEFDQTIPPWDYYSVRRGDALLGHVSVGNGKIMGHRVDGDGEPVGSRLGPFGSSREAAEALANHHDA